PGPARRGLPFGARTPCPAQGLPRPAGAAAVRPLTPGAPPQSWLRSLLPEGANLGVWGRGALRCQGGGRASAYQSPEMLVPHGCWGGFAVQQAPTEGRLVAAEGCPMKNFT